MRLCDIFRGRTSVLELMSLPAGVLYELHNIATKRIEEESKSHKIAGEHLEDEITGG